MTWKLDASAMKRTLARLRDVVAKPFAQARGHRQMRAIRRVQHDELIRGGRFTLSGTFERHKPTKEFGSRPATVPTLGGPSRSLGRAYLQGPVSIQPGRIVQTVEHPGARIHQHGGNIEITPRMRGKVRHAFGVIFSPDKKFVVIPARPMANLAAPQYQAAVHDQFEIELREAAA